MTVASFFITAGLVIPALVILFLSFVFSRAKSASVTCGVVAGLLMTLQCLFLWAAIGSGEAWSGRTSASDIPGYLLIGCVVVLVAYFMLTPRARGKNANDGAR